MTFYSFRLLSPVVQVYWVLKYGTYLAQRWENEGGVNLIARPARFPKQIHAVTATGFALKIALFIFAHALHQAGL